MTGYGSLIKQARGDMSQADLAKALGLTGAHDVSRIESEAKWVEPDLFDALVRALGIRPVALVEAMGYRLNLAPKEWAVPDELARVCADLDHEQLALVQRLARGLLAEGRDRPPRARRTRPAPP